MQQLVKMNKVISYALSLCLFYFLSFWGSMERLEFYVLYSSALITSTEHFFTRGQKKILPHVKVNHYAKLQTCLKIKKRKKLLLKTPSPSLF